MAPQPNADPFLRGSEHVQFSFEALKSSDASCLSIKSARDVKQFILAFANRCKPDFGEPSDAIFDSRGLGTTVVVVELLAVLALAFRLLATWTGRRTPLLPN